MSQESHSDRRQSTLSRSNNTITTGAPSITTSSAPDSEHSFMESSDSGNELSCSGNDLPYDTLPAPVPVGEGLRRSYTQGSSSSASSNSHLDFLDNDKLYDVPPSSPRHITSKSKSMKQVSTRNHFNKNNFPEARDIGYVQMVSETPETPESEYTYTDYMKMKDTPKTKISYNKTFIQAGGGFKNKGKTLQPVSNRTKLSQGKAHTLSYRTKPEMFIPSPPQLDASAVEG